MPVIVVSYTFMTGSITSDHHHPPLESAAGRARWILLPGHASIAKRYGSCWGEETSEVTERLSVALKGN